MTAEITSDLDNFSQVVDYCITCTEDFLDSCILSVSADNLRQLGVRYGYTL